MLTLAPKNIIQTATQLRDEQERVLEEAKQKNENRKQAIKAAFKSTFARKVSDESVIEGMNMTSVSPILTPTQTSTGQQTEKLNSDGTYSETPNTATVDTSMPLVEALRKHLASLSIIVILFLLCGSKAFAQTHEFEVTIPPDTEYIIGTDFSLFLQGGNHTVDLSWTASTDGGAYKIYRATASCSSSPTFSNIGTTAVNAVAFTDTGVIPNTYCYQITTLLNGLESVPSNNAPAVVLPASALNLKAVPN